jgi:fibro-slime domain-containing protein
MLGLESGALRLVLALAVSACSADREGAKSDAPGAAADSADEGDDHAEEGDAGRVADAGNPRDAKAEADRDAASAKPDRVSTPVVPPAPKGDCSNALEIVVRDFTEMHPDFEKFTAQVKGLVKDQLGPDKKPVYASTGGTAATTGPDAFKDWYNDVDGVNQRLSTKIMFVEQSAGVFVFDSTAFFPIDNMGFGNGPMKGGLTIPGIGTIGGGNTPEHNFLFTTEAHTRFTYQGGEKFTFRGDDDMWIFINDKLAIDLGGTHSALAATVDLDADASKLGLQKGETYPMDIFHAERHTDQSNYHIETTIDLSCIENVPVI